MRSIFAFCLLFTVWMQTFASEYYSCSVAWYFEPLKSTKSYMGGGKTEADAISVARNACLSANSSAGKGYCATSPASSRCSDVSQCTPARGLNDTGYPGKGHKTKWCKSQGFDGYDPHQRNCTRDCPSQCTRVPLMALGWTGGHKTNYCKALGFDGVHSAGKYKNGGYCYLGSDNICKN